MKHLRKKLFLGAVLALCPVVGLWETSVHAQVPAATNTVSGNKIQVKSRAFHLPIRLDEVSLPKVREVCLYMKEGKGEWVLKETVPPTARAFRVQVPHDGEFSFTVVTINHNGQAYPPDINLQPPAMTVVVRTPPVETSPSPAAPLLPPPLPENNVATPPAVSQPASNPIPLAAGSSELNPPLLPPAASPPSQPTSTTSPVNTTPNNVARIINPTPSTINTPTTGATNTPTLPTTNNPPAPPPCSSAVSIGSNRQILNTTRVAIDYNVGKVGPSGLSKVEVWATQDQGRNWQRIGEDTDQRSPAEVDLPGEGVFGIRLVATNGSGFGGKTPVAGDTPSTTIEVDQTCPAIQNFEVDSIARNGNLEIRWRATDKNLSPEPISISFASQRTGPWNLIAAKIKNEGSYQWTLPKDVPSQLFFRIEATDLANNIGHVETPAPILLDMTEPDVNVIGINALPQRASAPVGN